ncbi:MAG: pyruvate:ferredoxin (flavodoxin) oxidoreductase [Candidatus Cloacimonetes bacterium 4572_65]|nr:MAG: pyruvate:ferredoxin (flavodoxin) oxidoreductase [Candidatus Cloacimonetes bacterium 4572_65]
MAQFKKQTMDGNTAAAHVAYAFSEVAAIYPITPSSPMGEYTDAWAANGRKNIFGTTVDVAELQSEGGASGAVHGALSAGALTTTFTASQGLMLMLPNMHKIAGEMLPTNIWVSARSLAAQSLSIFGDHSDVMSARNTGFAMVSCNSIQEIMDLGIVSHLATLKTTIPFMTFFDGFRTSHEIQKIEVVDYEAINSLVEHKYIEDFRARALNPEAPRLKVGAQNPDVYFQGRETTNNQYAATPAIVEDYMRQVSALVGRDYNLFDYVGAEDAESLIIAMGSGCETIEEAVNYLNSKGKKYGLLKVRLYRPFSVDHFIKAIPGTVSRIAVLDRTKEPGSIGEPLYLDTVTALKEKHLYIIGGRYGLSSKEFTPGMVKSVFDHLDADGFHGFTVGINDDVSNLSLPITEKINAIPADTISCKFWGLGSDGTVGANKNSIKIIGDNTDLWAQGYFQYDSKKSGGITRSHLRFGESKIRAQYTVNSPDFVACHNPAFIGRYDILEGIKEGGVFLLNSQFTNEEAFANLTENMQQTILDKNISFYNINALEIAGRVGLGGRINTVMQAAFFIISKVLPKERAIELIKNAITKSYIKKGEEIVAMNIKAVDKVEEALVKIEAPAEMIADHIKMKKLISDDADEFTKSIIEPIMREKGDDIPVSAMPIDGFVPTGTASLEKRGVAPAIPHWDSEKCIQCNQCVMICPHAAIRAKLIPIDKLDNAPETFITLDEMMEKRKGDVKHKYKIQVYIDDCQGCKACIVECPKDALTMSPIEVERELGETANYEYFETLPNDVLGAYKVDSVKGSQFKQPLLEFSGACAGCGETPYAKLVTQLVGDRMLIANATGCSSIWGGTFPTIPYCKNKDGHGPAWANSLFEDNAEYAYGFRLAVNANRKQLRYNIEKLIPLLSCDGCETKFKFALDNWDLVTQEVKDNSKAIQELLPTLLEKATDETKNIIAKISELKSYFVEKSVWAFGGDGWAYDIGYGGLDHVLASNKNVNILVMDTEVYSNTGGQASKATPLGSVAKFAEAGKTTIKKDLGKMMMDYGYVYVASISMGSNKNQALKAIKEAEAYPGPSIILAYSPCINHGIDMSKAQLIEKAAVASGYWINYRYDPRLTAEGKNPFQLDSREPTGDPIAFVEAEKRYTALERTFPEKVPAYRAELKKWIEDRYKAYKKMAD